MPDALTPRTGISPALDFDTDHSYKLPPARIMWIMDKLGYAGPMNEYLGVFWWNERVLSGGSRFHRAGHFLRHLCRRRQHRPHAQRNFLGKTVFPADTLATIAYHFAAYINSTFVGAWASASGAVLTITGRSPATAYNLALSVSVTSSAGQATITQTPQPGVYGTWVVNDSANPPINRATRDWHTDFYAQCASRTRPGHHRTFDGTGESPVRLRRAVSRFYRRLHRHGLRNPGVEPLRHRRLEDAGVSEGRLSRHRPASVRRRTHPFLQYGEFLWWYFPLAQNLAVGYASYTSPSQSAPRPRMD